MDKLFVRLNAGMSSQYLYLSDLVDYGYFSNPLFYESGNPGLRPYKRYEVKLSVDFLNDFIFQTSFTKTCDQSITTYESSVTAGTPAMDYPYVVALSRNGSSEAFSSFLHYGRQFARHWDLQASASVTYATVSYDRYNDKGWYPGGYLGIAYFDSATSWIAQLQYQLSSTPNLSNPFGKTRGITDAMYILVQKSFFSQAFTASLYYQLPLHLAGGKIDSRVDVPVYRSFTTMNNQWRSNNQFSVVLEFNFGGGEKVRSNPTDILSL